MKLIDENKINEIKKTKKTQFTDFDHYENNLNKNLERHSINQDENKYRVQTKLSEKKHGNNWIVLITMLVLLGNLGGHRLYAGKKSGIVQLVMTLIWLPLLIVGILGFTNILTFVILSPIAIALTIIGGVIALANGIWLVIDLVNILLGNFTNCHGEVIRPLRNK